jgi:hypothetical protein
VVRSGSCGIAANRPGVASGLSGVLGKSGVSVDCFSATVATTVPIVTYPPEGTREEAAWPHTPRKLPPQASAIINSPEPRAPTQPLANSPAGSQGSSAVSGSTRVTRESWVATSGDGPVRVKRPPGLWALSAVAAVSGLLAGVVITIVVASDRQVGVGLVGSRADSANPTVGSGNRTAGSGSSPASRRVAGQPTAQSAVAPTTTAASESIGASTWGSGLGSNLALEALVSASFAMPVESVLSINDGIDPASSNDVEKSHWEAWPLQRTTQWVRFAWTKSQKIGRVEVYFYDGGGRIQLPVSWSVQYWNGGGFVNVNGASGYPVEADKYNSVTFTPISTRYLRVLLEPTRSSVGLCQIRAYGS